MYKTSPNGEYELRISLGYLKNGNRLEDGVTLRYDGEVQFEAYRRAPSNGAVSNSGISAVIGGKSCDESEKNWNEDSKSTTLYIFDAVGDLIAQEEFQTTAGIYGCSIDGTGSYVAISGPDEGNVILYDVDAREVAFSRDYTDIQLAYSIAAIRYDDTWGFKLIDESQGTSVCIDIDGGIIEGINDVKKVGDGKEGDGKEGDSLEEPIVDSLKRQGLPVPDTVFGITGPRSDLSRPNSASQEQFGFLLDQGPIYDPEWCDYRFAVPNPLTAIYVIGPESISEAADAFDMLERVERIDLSNWFKIQSASPTANQGAGKLEAAIRPASKSEPKENGISMDDGAFSLDSDKVLDTILKKKFFGDTDEEESQSPLNDHKGKFPDNDYGTDLYQLIDKKAIVSEAEFAQFTEESDTKQVVDSYIQLLDLLDTGEVFPPYSIDSRSRCPSVLPVFNAVAKESPETVIQSLERLEGHLQNRQSITAPEVACSLIQTLIDEHPHKFSSFVSLLDRLLENRSAHPKRRALDIIETAIKSDNSEVVFQLSISDGSFVDVVLRQMETTESVWLLSTCCSVLYWYDLDDTDLDAIEEKMELLVDALQFGGDRRIQPHLQGLMGPGMDATTDDELADALRSSRPNAGALYRLNKHGAGKLLRDIARERPESVLPYIDQLIQDFTVSAEGMDTVRETSKRILNQMVQNLPKEQFDTLSEYDDIILPLLQDVDQCDALFAFEWARRSRSQAAFEALVSIHEDGTNPHWQVATAILEDLAPGRIDPEIEPDNARQEWVSFVMELAEENGCLPQAKDVSREGPGYEQWKHPDAPDSEYWEVFPDSWQGVLDALDIDTERRTGGAPLRGRLINDLQRMHEELGKPPTTTEIDHHSKFSYYDYKEEFGGIKKAREVAGVNRDSISETTEQEDAPGSSKLNPTNATPTRSQLTEAIVELAESIGDAPTTTQMNNQGAFSMSAYYSDFDTWNEALEAAGITPTRSARSTGTTQDELRAELRRLGNELGKTPKTTDVKSESDFSLGRYYNEYDSWSDALSDAGFSE